MLPQQQVSSLNIFLAQFSSSSAHNFVQDATNLARVFTKPRALLDLETRQLKLIKNASTFVPLRKVKKKLTMTFHLSSIFLS
jgi:4-hydroxy-L-threonine phosphate dehydrogenase PdxA